MNNPKDNLVRNAMYVGIADRKGAVFAFCYDAGLETAFVRINVRFRGIKVKNDNATLDAVDDFMNDKSEVVLIINDRPECSNMPILVDVYDKDGEEYINKSLVEYNFATKFKKV